MINPFKLALSLKIHSPGGNMTLMHKTVARVLAATLSLSAVSAFAATDLTGAGGTFPAPVYARWAADYQKANGS